MALSFDTTTTFPQNLEACGAILLSASWLQENTYNEETLASPFLVGSPSLLIIDLFFHIFWGKQTSG